MNAPQIGDMRYRWPPAEWIRENIRRGFDTVAIAAACSKRSGTPVSEASIWNILARDDAKRTT